MIRRALVAGKAEQALFKPDPLRLAQRVEHGGQHIAVAALETGAQAAVYGVVARGAGKDGMPVVALAGCALVRRQMGKNRGCLIVVADAAQAKRAALAASAVAELLADLAHQCLGPAMPI